MNTTAIFCVSAGKWCTTEHEMVTWQRKALFVHSTQKAVTWIKDCSYSGWQILLQLQKRMSL